MSQNNRHIKLGHGVITSHGNGTREGDERERDGGGERERDRQTDRQTEIETDRQTDREAERDRDRNKRIMRVM